jgi:hypothetical protein
MFGALPSFGTGTATAPAASEAWCLEFSPGTTLSPLSAGFAHVIVCVVIVVHALWIVQ